MTCSLARSRRPFLAGQLGVMLALAAAVPAHGQDYDRFNLSLDLNTVSAEQTLDLFQGRGGMPETIARLRGSRIAIATTAMLTQRALSQESLVAALVDARFNQSLGSDPFHLTETRAGATEIQELLQEVKRRNFGQKVVSTVQQLFPPGTRLTQRVPVFFVALGPPNVDAFVRRVVWHGDEPQFVGEGEGDLTIVVNLTKAILYGRDVDERFIGLMSVVAHEVFHAAFGVYKDASPVWRSYYASANTPMEALMDLAQNEGIAYYLTLIQQTRGRLIYDWAGKARTGMEDFNRKSAELMDPTIPSWRVREILQTANTSAYWESFGSIAGMIMARQIDNTLGSQALSETIARGPADFFRKYVQAYRQGGQAPPLSDAVIRFVDGLRY